MEIGVDNQPGIHTAQDGTKNVTILCCICGGSFSASSTGTSICLKCLSSQVDITTGITKEGTLEFCKKCNRFLRPPWTHAELESKTLLDICLRKIRGLNKVKLIDANFIWTEPHSRRVKIKLTVQKEVMNNASVQQSFPVEFVINYLQCEDCKKEFTPHKWKAVVQLRQKVDHKKTFLYIEQLILKNNLHDKMIDIQEVQGGVDFFFKEKAHALKLVEFLQGLLPVRVKPSKQLISQNEHTSTYNFKFSFSVDIPRICKEDLVILKPKLATALGGCGKLLLCTKVASMIQLVDVVNMRVIDMSGSQYFQHEDEMMFVPAKGNLTEFMVFDIETVDSKNLSVSTINTAKYKASTANIGRVSDWENFEVKTHLGDILNEGSTAMGYDLASFNLTGLYDELAALGNLPDVILVRKVYPERTKKKKNWKLKHLEKQERGANNFYKASTQKDKDQKDYEEFLDELERDAELRANVNLYKDDKAVKGAEKERVVANESASEAKTETDAKTDTDVESKKDEKVPKKKAKAKGKGKKNARKDEDEEEWDRKEKEMEERKLNAERAELEENDDYDGVPVDELLNDLNLEDVKIGTKIDEDDGKAEPEEHDVDDENLEDKDGQMTQDNTQN